MNDRHGFSPPKAAIYCRLSEEDHNKQSPDTDSNSIQNQKAMLIQYAKEQGWDIYRIYSDDDYTGADRRRPEFRQLLKDAQARKFDIVLCKSQSRFTRELELVEKYIHTLFPLWQIRFVSIVDNADTENKGNKKSRQINGLVNEWYIEDMSENIKSVLTSRRKNGLHIGAFALYGYQKDPEQKGHLIIDEEAAAVVREVFSMFAAGYGKTAIARILNEKGIPNPTEYKRQKGLRFRQPNSANSTLWKYHAISSMLTNEIYIGNMVQGRYGSISYKTKENRPRPKAQWYIVEGTHAPIIERKLWDRVQSMIREKTKPFTTGKIGIFAGKVYCGYCGCALRSTKNRNRHYLQCQTRYICRDGCVGVHIPVAELERIVITERNRLTAQYLNKEELSLQVILDDQQARKCLALEERIALCEKCIRDCSQSIRQLYLDKVKGILCEEDFVALSEAFCQERQKNEYVLEEYRNELQALQERLQAGNDRTQRIEQYIHAESLNRETVQILIDRIIIGRRDPITKAVPVQIYWNF